MEALKELEGFPSMGMEIEDGRSVFRSLSSRVALPMDRRKGYGYGIVDYGLNKLDVEVDRVNYRDRFKQVMLFDEDGDVVAHIALRYLTRKEWLIGELCGRGLHGSMNVDQYEEYALSAAGAVFAAEADGLTGVFVNWLALSSPVDHVVDRGDALYIRTEAGSAVELLFKEGEDDER